MTRELHLVDAGPDAGDVAGVHAEHQLAHRRVKQAGDRARRAAVVGLAPTDMAFVGFDADEHRVALDAAADAEAHRLVGGNGKRDRDGAEVSDAHGDRTFEMG